MWAFSTSYINNSLILAYLLPNLMLHNVVGTSVNLIIHAIIQSANHVTRISTICNMVIQVKCGKVVGEGHAVLSILEIADLLGF